MRSLRRFAVVATFLALLPLVSYDHHSFFPRQKVVCYGDQARTKTTKGMSAAIERNGLHSFQRAEERHGYGHGQRAADDDEDVQRRRREGGEEDGGEGEGGGKVAGPIRRARTQRFSRAKTGCFTCRARRKKCDETRDDETGSCQRCVKSGIECLGFPKMRVAPLAAHSKRQKADEAAAEVVPESVVQPVALSPHPPPAPSSCGGDQMASDLSSVSIDELMRDDGLLSPHPLPSVPLAIRNQIATLNELSFSDLLNMETPQLSESNGAVTSSNEGRTRQVSPFDFGNLPFEFLASVQGYHSNQQHQHHHQQSGLPIQSTQQQQQFVPRQLSPSISDWMPEWIVRSKTPPRSLQMAPRVPRDEDRAIKALATFYGAFCWHWWIPRRSASKRRTLHHIVHAVEKRLRKSEIACTTVAAVAACYGFGNIISLNNDLSVESFRQSWERIYEVVCDTKTSSLNAYFEWLGTTANGGKNDEGGKMVAAVNGGSWDGTRNGRNDLLGSMFVSPIEAQADRLFSFASKVLSRVALAAKPDQESSECNVTSTPLEYAALVHVDVYVQASMDLALFAYACRPASVFHRELNNAAQLLDSLLGRGQCVRLHDIDGIDAAGFRTFAWCDIANAAVTGRSTRLHYLHDDAGEDQHVDAHGNDPAQMSDNGGDERSSRRSQRRKRVQISFGCPDDVLIIFAHIANLHVQLTSLRKTGAIKGNGSDALPAWALFTVSEITQRIEKSEKNAERQGDPHQWSGQELLAAIWRHAAFIFLHTTALRLGPLGKVNQERMRAILDLWSGHGMQREIVSNGNPALPLLLAAFVAQQPEERATCREALQKIGEGEVSRAGYRAFVERLWRRTDEAGFAFLWCDLLDGADDSVLIAIM